ncbi:MAG: hypothetical protein Ct9H300mP25_14090 [Acidobacteriota bacterium]|nr:MAG: hypothetical protein Ct9H300mP25_14090 [Acidobacteriota bacterium]
MYVLGAAGMLVCLNAETGDFCGGFDTVDAYGATVPVYGVSSAPVVEGEVLIAVIGGDPDAKVFGFESRLGKKVACVSNEHGNRLFVAYRDRRRRGAATDTVASCGVVLAEPGNRRGLLGTRVSSR